MKTKTKLLVGAAVAAGVGIYLWRRRKPTNGKVHLSELNTLNCKCYQHDHMVDGTVVSTEVPRWRCKLDGLGAEFQDCP